MPSSIEVGIGVDVLTEAISSMHFQGTCSTKTQKGVGFFKAQENVECCVTWLG